jgi:hypothetical protein
VGCSVLLGSLLIIVHIVLCVLFEETDESASENRTGVTFM